MYRTVISLPEETRDQLVTLSRALNVPRAQLMREAIAHYVATRIKEAPAIIKKQANEAIKEIESLSDLL